VLWKVHKLLLSEAYNNPFFSKKINKFRAGHKLEAAIKEFGIICDGKIALDSGLSTGGFTDCLLQHGASHVYGVDVGYGQVNNYLFEIT
jgi:predicted rRNA methylase YqxC with S4 and FtsJ domains